MEKFKNAAAICSDALSMGGRTELIRLGGRRCVGRVYSVVYNFTNYNASAASAVTRGSGHMLSEKSQRTQNGTMFVDLD